MKKLSFTSPELVQYLSVLEPALNISTFIGTKSEIEVSFVTEGTIMFDLCVDGVHRIVPMEHLLRFQVAFCEDDIPDVLHPSGTSVAVMPLVSWILLFSRPAETIAFDVIARRNMINEFSRPLAVKYPQSCYDAYVEWYRVMRMVDFGSADGIRTYTEAQVILYSSDLKPGVTEDMAQDYIVLAPRQY